MDAADLERVDEALQDFHVYFAPAFGRKQWREHSRHYLQGLLAGTVSGAAQRREPLGDGSGIAAGDAAFSHRGSLGR